ncbi:N-6 DNA methylase, partial [Acinetobacter sp. 163]|nr:N-6 DNA methylase [Acinetobacter sp. 163]
NIFYGTSIPTCVIVVKKNRKPEDDILFIDASNDFEKSKNQNYLRDEDVDKIVDTYRNRKEIEKYSKKVSMKEIE